MKKLLVVMFTLFTCSFAFAEGWYVGIDLGYGKFTMEDVDGDKAKPDAGAIIGLNVGKSIPLGVGALRPELTFSYALAVEDDDAFGTGIVAEYSNFAFMANVYYDFTLKSVPLTFFPTAGMGLVFNTVKVDAANYDESDSSFAYQVGAGMRYNFTEHHSVDFVARYIYVGEPEYDAGPGAVMPLDTTGFNVTLGYKFWF